MRAPVGMESISRAIGIVEEEEEIDSSGESLFYERSRVPQYILDRGFTLDTLKEWGVGYDSITNTAVLPVRVDGKLIGLIRRKISTQDDGPKYLYTSGMRKSEVLFGLDKALKFNSNKIILVEGPLDAMWLHQYGYPAVAILGAGISQEQATLVRKHFWEVVLAFDSDSAGQKAIAIGARALSGLRTSSITLPPEKKDVQECTEDELVDVFSNTKSVWQNFSLLGTFNKYEKKSKR
jgi:DNA primase